MSRAEQFQHSILTVSAEERFFPLIKRSLAGLSAASVEYRTSAAAARRCILERYYSIVVVNAPLPDGAGTELALDTARECGASVLLIVPDGVYEDTLDRVTDAGILVLAKPFPLPRITHAMRFLSAQQAKLREAEQRILAAEEKVQEVRLVDKAKFLLIEHRHLSEDEAHRLIGKQAMNHGVSRKRIAQRILEEYEE